MIGPGKYDAECEVVRAETGAAAIVLCVLGGKSGNGFSVSIDGRQSTNPIATLATIPAVLREMAQSIETDLKAMRERSGS